ncbi:MAG: hypothetical protein RLZZ584_1887 [Pseudomonadota bacterium]|jgi:uncharacterized OsmC-like protein
MSDTPATLRLTQLGDYRFEADFGAGIVPAVFDEPPPLGQGSGASPTQLLAAAVGNCLSASLLFALRKYRQQPEPIRCELSVSTGRNAENRLRVQQIVAKLHLGKPAAELEHLQRVLDSFESYCTVTQTVRGAVDVAVEVYDVTGVRLK